VSYVSPPERAATCDAEIHRATATEFLLQNRLKPRNFVWGALDPGGTLEFWIENLPKDGTGCPGWWMFEQMMGYFSPHVTAIQGNWTYGDNLATVNAITATGVSLEVAALRGPTGRFAASHGYRKVSVLSTVGLDGAYSSVKVLFEK
jgi:hypothetical protein